MRYPSGYGSVIRLGGKRRRPYAVRISVGWTTDGKQKYKYLGYYERRRDADLALAEYNRNPYDVDAGKITWGEMFEKYGDQKFEKISYKNMQDYRAAERLCASIEDMRVADIKASHLQAVVDHSGKNHPTLRKLKVLMSQMYKYAIANDIVQVDYSQFVDIGSPNKVSTRVPFSSDEIDRLWETVDRMNDIDTILIMIYTGLRIGELLTIRTEDVQLDQRYLRGGIKTEAGKNRVVPIHTRIEPLVRARVDLGHKTLIALDNGKPLPYSTYRSRWDHLMEQLQMKHRPHDCRHTFASLMDSAGANKLCIKRIMGHASSDITDKVYTHKNIQELIASVDLL